MTTPARPAARPHLLLWVAALLTPAVFVVPAAFVAGRGYRGESALVAATEQAFVSADLSGPVADSRALAQLTTVWREFHLVKALLAVLLVLALAGLARTVRRRTAGATGGRRRLLTAAHSGVLVWLLAALTVALANAQGAAAPFASVASFLPPGQATGELRGVLEALRQAVQTGEAADGIANALLGDFTWYHGVFAALAATTGVALVIVALRTAWLRWRLRGPGRRPQPTWLAQTTLYGAAGGLFVLLAVANVSTWLHPVPALVASLGGG